MSLAIEKILAPASGHATQSKGEVADQTVNISVVFTSLESALGALKEAGNLASGMGARIMLLVFQIVPYPLPLETPPVLLDFNENRFRVIASQSSVETSVQIFLCRDRFQTLISVLKPGALVVVGGRRRRWPWWATKDERLARKLRRTGCEVLFKERE